MSLVISRCIEFKGSSSGASGEITCVRGSEKYFSIKISNLVSAHVEIIFDNGIIITSAKNSAADWSNPESKEIFSWGSATSFYLRNFYTPDSRSVTYYEGYVYFYEVAK